jgi:hypothetical protein
VQTNEETHAFTGVQATQLSGVVGPPGFNQNPGSHELQREVELEVQDGMELQWGTDGQAAQMSGTPGPPGSTK